MAQVGTNEFRAGVKVEIEKEPYIIVSNEFVKPGKGQPFNRVKLKHLLTGRVVERTFKSGERLDLADVQESSMRMVYKEATGVVFMDDTSYEQVIIPFTVLEDQEKWLMEEVVYDVTFYKGNPIAVSPPTFMEMVVTETSPAVRGDTSGRVMKEAVLESGAKVQVPIFIETNQKIKIDTRTGEYVSRV